MYKSFKEVSDVFIFAFQLGEVGEWLKPAVC